MILARSEIQARAHRLRNRSGPVTDSVEVQAPIRRGRHGELVNVLGRLRSQVARARGRLADRRSEPNVHHEPRMTPTTDRICAIRRLMTRCDPDAGRLDRPISGTRGSAAKRRAPGPGQCTHALREPSGSWLQVVDAQQLQEIGNGDEHSASEADQANRKGVCLH